MLGLNTRTKNTGLMEALGMKKAMARILQCKLTFLRNLYKNPLTEQIIQAITEDIKANVNKIKQIRKSWVSNIIELTGMEKFDPIDIIERLSTKIMDISKSDKLIRELEITKKIAGCLKYFTKCNKFLLSQLIRIEFNQKE